VVLAVISCLGHVKPFHDDDDDDEKVYSVECCLSTLQCQDYDDLSEKNHIQGAQ